MDWKRLIRELQDEAKLSQAEIGAACGVSQAAVSDLSRIEGRTPAWDFGEKLRLLHKSRVGETKREATQDRAEARADERREDPLDITLRRFQIRRQGDRPC